MRYKDWVVYKSKGGKGFCIYLAAQAGRQTGHARRSIINDNTQSVTEQDYDRMDGFKYLMEAGFGYRLFVTDLFFVQLQAGFSLMNNHWDVSGSSSIDIQKTENYFFAFLLGTRL